MLNQFIINKCRTIFISNIKLSSAASSLTNTIISKFPKKKAIYEPPENFDEDFLEFSRQFFSVDIETNVLQIELNDPMQKFSFLSQCQMKFNKAITNSFLAHLCTVKDVQKYMKTNVTLQDRLAKFEANKNMLPKNLFVQKDPIRFDPKTDTMFSGVTAFPHSDVIETDLEALKKYPCIKATRTRKIQINREDLY